MAKRKRDYRREYDTYQGTEKQKRNRALRNAARREATRDGKVRKGDGKEVDHKRSLDKGGSNSESNWQILSRRANRVKFNN
jgi:5-methylcytosine-specific restriction endonuclease McrA